MSETPSTTPPMRPAPSVSLVLIAYNHEAFIEEAVASCLAMDYAPMQIILSDDCSTDGTFDIMERLVAAYDGPNDVLLNRNEKNQYLEHLTNLTPRMTGDLIVLVCGDDIQHPDRVKRVVERWQQTGATVITNQARIITPDGKPGNIHPPAPASPFELSLDHFLRDAVNAACFGVGLSWHRELTDTFGPVKLGARNLDRVFPFRGLLMNGCEFIAEPLAEWRHHADNMSIAIQMKQSEDVMEQGKWIESHHLNNMANLFAMMEDAQKYLSQQGRQQDLAKTINALSGLLTSTIQAWLPVRHVLAQGKVEYH
ncbi:MAG: glycosyltransferase [Pseudomonadota bacterium]